jgi:hypothetical protein
MITISRLRESPQTVEEEQGRGERAPPRYGRVSGGRTEALVAQADREVTTQCRNGVSSC